MLLENASVYIKDAVTVTDSSSDYLSHDIEYRNSKTFGVRLNQLSAYAAQAALGTFSHNVYSCRFRQPDLTIQSGSIMVDSNNKEYRVLYVNKMGEMYNCIVEAY